MEGDIHCLLGWVGALAGPWPAIFRNYRSVIPGITMTALGSGTAISTASPDRPLILRNLIEAALVMPAKSMTVKEIRLSLQVCRSVRVTVSTRPRTRPRNRCGKFVSKRHAAYHDGETGSGCT
jgi:hypothetical protein